MEENNFSLFYSLLVLGAVSYLSVYSDFAFLISAFLSSPISLLNSNDPEMQMEGRQRAREPRDTVEAGVL